MYRPTMYSKHDESLAIFVDLFNNSPVCKHIVIEPNEYETYGDDGKIINLKTNEQFGFDWEFRDRYFSNGVFDFDSLGQYERKIIKPSIKLSLQCDSTQTSVAIGWHDDWLDEMQSKLHLLTDSKKQFGTVRYTKKFIIIKYTDMDRIKIMINNAFVTRNFNHLVFE